MWREDPSSRMPWRISWYTGRHKTRSSGGHKLRKSKSSSFLKCLIHAEVSTRYTSILAHFGKIGAPYVTGGVGVDLFKSLSSDQFAQSEVNNIGIGLEAHQGLRTIEDLFIKHKICTFHVSRIRQLARVVKSDKSGKRYPGNAFHQRPISPACSSICLSGSAGT